MASVIFDNRHLFKRVFQVHCSVKRSLWAWKKEIRKFSDEDIFVGSNVSLHVLAYLQKVYH